MWPEHRDFEIVLKSDIAYAIDYFNKLIGVHLSYPHWILVNCAYVAKAFEFTASFV